MFDSLINKVPAYHGLERSHPFIHGVLTNTLAIKVIYLISCVLQVLPYVNYYTGRFNKIVLAYGFLMIVYDLISNRSIFRNRYIIWILAFLGFAILSVIVNHDQQFFGNIKILMYTVIELLVIACLSAQKPREETLREFRIINKLAIWLLSIVCVLSFLTFILDLRILYNVGGTGFFLGISDENRLYGITGNPNALGAVSVLTIILCIVQLYVFQKHTRFRKFGYIFAAVVAFFCSLLSNSRAAHGSSLVFMAILIFFSCFYRKCEWPLLKNIVRAGLVTVIAILAINIIGEFISTHVLGYIPALISYLQSAINPPESGPGYVFQPVETQRNDTATMVGGSGRFVLWTAALKVFVDYPFFGVGLHNLEEFAQKAMPNVKLEGLQQGNIHNIYIQTFVSYGVFTGLAFFAMLFVFLVDGIKRLITCFKAKVEPKLFIAVIATLCFILAHEFFDLQILYRVSILSFMFAGYLGVFMNELQRDKID